MIVMCVGAQVLRSRLAPCIVATKGKAIGEYVHVQCKVLGIQLVVACLARVKSFISYICTPLPTSVDHKNKKEKRYMITVSTQR